MNITPDLMLDREKLRSQIKKWKWLFIIAIAILVIFLNKNSNINEEDHIARLTLEGTIFHDSDLIEELKSIEKNSKVKALLVHIDSPGGSSFAGEELYETFKKIKTTKPIISVLGTVAASGGYMVALASDYIIARNMTLTGSIGVLFQSFEAVELANKLGIKFVSFKSSPLKASPNPMEQTSLAAQEAAMDNVNDSYNIFLNMLIESRKFSKEQAIKLANGKTYIGKRAKELNLIDEIGGEEEAIKWLETNKKIHPSLPIKNVTWGKHNSFFEELTKFLHNSNILIKSFMNNNESIMAVK